MPTANAIGAYLTTRRSLLLLVLIGMGFLYPLWTTSDIVYSKHSDIISEHLGTKVIEREAISTEGRIPLWNPSMNAGMPALANPQAMYLFPFDLLFLALPLGIATNLVILLNFLLAGVAMFLFSRRYFSHPATALICGVAYMLSHRYLAMIYSGWLPKMSMFALTPLLFWACDLVLERPARRTIAAVAVVGALTLLQGDMQQLYYAAVACVLWILLRLIAAGWRQQGGTIGRLAVGGLLAVMLAAPALLPRLQFASVSTRTEVSYDFLLRDSPVPADLLTFFSPHDTNPDGGVRNGFWENNFYFGCWLLPLWLIAFLGKKRRAALLLALGIGAIVVLCFDTVVVRTFYDHLPGFNLFRQPSRLLLLAQFAAVFLAGLGADTLLGAGFLGPRSRLALAGVMLLAPVLDSALRIAPLITTEPLANVLPRHSYHDLLDRQHNEGRVLAIAPTSSPSWGRAALLYGTAAYFGIDMVNGVTALELRDYSEYFTILKYGTTSALLHRPMGWSDCSQIAKPEMLRALDVRYIIGDPSLYVEAMGAERIWQSPRNAVFIFYQGVRSIPVAVWRLGNPLGPAYFATSVHPVESDAQSLQSLVQSSSALDASVFGIGGEARRLDFSGGNAAFIERGFNRYRYRIESGGNNFLILSQVWYPGWRATLDGAPVKLYRTNHALLGCVVPRGTHELVLEMTSPPLLYGLAAAALGTAAVVLLLSSKAGRRQAPE